MLEHHGIACHPIPMAETPREQHLRQYIDARGLQKKLESVTARLEDRGFSAVMIFCNSLTTALDMEALKKQTSLQIITPFDVYARIVQDWQDICIIAANGHTIAHIEAFMLLRNPEMKIAGFSSLGFVKLIETTCDPRHAFDAFPFTAILAAAQQMKTQAVVLGCTHLSYILPQITRNCPLPVVDTGTVMIRLVQTALGHCPLTPLSGPQNC